MVVDNEGKIFDNRRKSQRREQEVKVKTDKRKSDRRVEKNNTNKK